MSNPIAFSSPLPLLAGLAGVLGGCAWVAGDLLLLGNVVDTAAYPALFDTADPPFDPDMARYLLASPTPRLAAGALVAIFATPLYLAGAWHLWRGLAPGGRQGAAACLLMATGFAWSPLPHAAFYFYGAVCHALAAAGAPQPLLVEMAAEFMRVLQIPYYPALIAQFAGLLWFSILVARRRSVYPRWFAVGANPLALGAAILVAALATGGAPARWLGVAAFNVIWLLVFAQSLWLRWRLSR